jgi:hypothetical protein
MPDATPELIIDRPWSTREAQKWLSENSIGRRGLCGWEHKESDHVTATRVVLVRDSKRDWGYGCCDECYPRVRSYCGLRDEVP